MLSSATKIRARISTVTGHGGCLDSWTMQSEALLFHKFSLNYSRRLDSSFRRFSTGDKCQSGEQSRDQKERSGRPSKATGKSGPGTMARSLVKTVMSLSHVKEEVYGALDKWAAFELKFPLEATMNGLRRLRDSNQWHRVIQVSKWMLSKGIGRTNGTYSLLLRAYCMEGRLDDADALWEKVIALNDRSTPKNMFSFMTHIYKKHEMPEKVIKVFEQMESFGIKPDVDVLRRAREAYYELGIEGKQEELTKKHPLNSKLRRNERRIAARKALKASTTGVLAKDEAKLGIDVLCEESTIFGSSKIVLPEIMEKSNSVCKEINMEIFHGGSDKMQSSPSRRPLGNVKDIDTEVISAFEVFEPEIERGGDKKKSSSSRESLRTAQKDIHNSPAVLHRKRKVGDKSCSDNDAEFVKQIIATM